MEGFTETQKEELQEIVGSVVRERVGSFEKKVDGKFESFERRVDDKIDSLAQMIQAGFSETATKAELRSELERVHDRLNTIEDKISYQRVRDDVIEGRIDKVEGRVAALEGRK